MTNLCRLVLCALLLAGLARPAAAQFADPDNRYLHNDLAALIAAVKGAQASNDARLEALLAQLKAGAPVTGGNTAPPATGTPTTLADPCAGRGDKWVSLTLKPTDSIKLALACAAPGFKLTLAAGTYGYQSVNFNHEASFGAVEIAGAGAGLTKLDGGGGCTVAINNLGSGGGCATRLAFGNGVVRTQTSLYIHDLEISGGGINATDGHDLQAGLYLAVANGTVTAERVMFRGNQNGVAGNAAFFTNSVVNIKSSDFVNNSTDGGSHDCYISGPGSVVNLTDSNFYGSLHGNNCKMRVKAANVSGGYNRSGVPGTAEAGRWLECPDGCALTIKGGDYSGNNCCANVFGNGTEHSVDRPGLPAVTTIAGARFWIGPRSHDFWTDGAFTATGVTVTCASGGSITNGGGKPLAGLACGAANDNPLPVPAYASGAK